jgi:hypothetical protein
MNSVDVTQTIRGKRKEHDGGLDGSEHDGGLMVCRRYRIVFSQLNSIRPIYFATRR